MYPYIFLDGSKISTYSILSSIGAVFSVFLWNHLLLKKNLVRKYTFNIVMVLPGILIGGKVFGALSTGLGNLVANRQFDLYGSIKQSGIVYYGGLFGVLLMEYLICRIRRQNFAELSDILTIGIPLFHCFGRVGCFFAGCCYGVESNSLIYAKNSVGGASLVSKEKKRIAEWINEIIDIGCEEEGFLLASGLAWMGLYDLEREVLRHLFDRKVKFEIEYQDRLSFLEGGGNTNIKIHDVEGMEGFLFDSSVEGWNKDAYDMFFRKLEMTHKSLEYSLMISKWTKTLPLASGQEISQGQMEEAFEDLVKDFDNEIILSREPAKAVNLANVEYKSPFIFRFTSERNRCVTMLFSSDKFGRNLNISILTMFTPEKELDNEEMKKYALAIKDNIYVESFRESICQVVDQLIKEKVTIYDEEEVPRKIFS